MVVLTEIVIDGATFTNVKECKVNKSIGDNNSAGTFMIKMPNDNGEFSDTFTVGSIVEISTDQDTNPDEFFPFKFPYSFPDRSTKIFKGRVEDIDFTGDGAKTQFIILKGRDGSSDLQNATITPIVYNDTEISSIVTQIMTDNVPTISIANVNIVGKIKPHRAYNHETVFDAIKQLAIEVGFFFYVDENFDLHFEQKDNVASGKTLDKTNITKSRFRTSDRTIQNRDR